MGFRWLLARIGFARIGFACQAAASSALPGSKEGASEPSSRARQHAVNSSKTLRFCCRHVATTLSIRSTKRLPTSVSASSSRVRNRWECCVSEEPRTDRFLQQRQSPIIYHRIVRLRFLLPSRRHRELPWLPLPTLEMSLGSRSSRVAYSGRASHSH